MRSSLSKQIWLIQPPDPVPPVTLVDAAGGATVRFSPAWDLLCLQSFLLERTGHICNLIDTRIFDDLNRALKTLDMPVDQNTDSVVIVYADVLNLGFVGYITGYIHAHYPSMTIVLCGPMVDSFPETVRLIPHVQFGLCGDPEVILRNLLDFIDISHRLKLVPGLIMPDEPPRPPHWMERLQALSLPEWYRVSWSSYKSTHDHGGSLRVEARLSRGMPNGIDRMFFPKPNEPVRVWPLSAMSQSFQKSAGQGIAEIFLADPPGFWTDERIAEWCRHLNVFRNTQPWGIQLFPRDIPDDLLEDMGGNACHRVEFIIPTCDPALRERYGLTYPDDQLRELIIKMEARNISAQLIYWIQGPDEKVNESTRVSRHIASLGYPKFALHPFPFHHDSLLYRDELAKGKKLPTLTEWITWGQKPDLAHPPVALWEGVTGLIRCRSTMQSIQRKLLRNPGRHINRISRQLHLFNQFSNVRQQILRWIKPRARNVSSKHRGSVNGDQP